MARPVYWAVLGGWLLIGIGAGSARAARVDRRPLSREPA